MNPRFLGMDLKFKLNHSVLKVLIIVETNVVSHIKTLHIL